MTRLNDPSFIGFDGEPVTGRVPPRLFVYGEMSPAQRGLVAHAYKLFCDAKRVNVGGFLVQNRKLDDGTRVRMVALQGQDQVTVWPTGGPTKLRLPHGFAVVANWDRPRIFKRKTSTTPPLVAWATDPVPVPQAKTALEADNHVFRASGATSYFAHPMVLTDAATRSLWDYLKHGVAALASANPIIPLCTQAGADYNTGVTHYGIDNTILNAAGATLYTMTISTAILVSPETPVHAPASTTAAGTQVVLQHIRLAIISDPIYTARFANERLARLDEANYSLTERNVVSFNGPIGGSTPPSGSSAAVLNETMGSVSLKVGYIDSGGGGATAASAYYSETRTYETFFVYGIALDITAVSSTVETAYDEQGTFTPAAATAYTKTVAAVEASAVAYPDLIAAANASGHVRWRGGYKQYGLATPGSVFGGDAWYGTHLLRKDRIDVEYTLTTAPVTEYVLGWTNLKLLDGTTSGVCVGKTHTDSSTSSRSLSNWDGDHLANDYLFAGAAPTWSGDIAGDGTTAGLWPAWKSAALSASILPAVYTELAPYPSTPAVTTTTLFNNRPVTTGSYTLTSRYVIDYDHKGQFYAAIKVVVECAGAEWRESGYQGNMVPYTAPDYSVDIYLETNWKGTVSQTLLTTSAATRPAFEFVPIVKQNPYYFLTGDVGKQDMKVFLPPSFGLPIEAMTQIKTICSHQGAGPHLACADVRPDITGDAATKARSTAGIEFSTVAGGLVTPHTKYVTGQLYARTFKLSDFADALWLLHSTKCDATLNDLGAGATYYYMSALKTTIDSTTFRVEVRDGVHEPWSDEFMPGSSPPAFIARDTKLYRV